MTSANSIDMDFDAAQSARKRQPRLRRICSTACIRTDVCKKDCNFYKMYKNGWLTLEHTIEIKKRFDQAWLSEQRREPNSKQLLDEANSLYSRYVYEDGIKRREQLRRMKVREERKVVTDIDNEWWDRFWAQMEQQSKEAIV